jgi:hypothetical protein
LDSVRAFVRAVAVTAAGAAGEDGGPGSGAAAGTVAAATGSAATADAVAAAGTVDTAAGALCGLAVFFSLSSTSATTGLNWSGSSSKDLGSRASEAKATTTARSEAERALWRSPGERPPAKHAQHDTQSGAARLKTSAARARGIECTIRI